jgi:PIN domain nuclease of toxin-antitoxin system
MSDYVADTHALYWYLTQDRKLGSQARSAFQNAEAGGGLIYVSSISIAELYYLMVKAGAVASFPALYTTLSQARHVRLVPFEAEDVLRFDALASIPEMHDRIIAGVAFQRQIPCLTRDPAIVGSGIVMTIW